jgi:hypothetical protein
LNGKEFGIRKTSDSGTFLFIIKTVQKHCVYNIVIVRILNGVMVLFFLTAVSLLREDDNSCLWIPTFLVPAFLSTIVAVKPQLSGIQLHNNPPSSPPL